MQTYVVQCEHCKKNYGIEADSSDMERWENGEFAQDVLGYLDKTQRELLISQTCGDCWNDIFNFDLDFDD